MANLTTFRTSQDPIALENLDLKNKNVLVRVDFNCPMENGKITNNYRIQETLPTLINLKNKGVKKITLVTHFARPDGEFKSEMQLRPVKEELEKLWGEKVDCPEYFPYFDEYAKKITGSVAAVVMWENVRFWPGEEKNDPLFARALTQNQEIFINEAFSASHRVHASIVGTAKILPAYAGWRLAEEVRKIYQLMNQSASPSVAIVGGAKIETKIPVLEALEKNYDQILLGGKIALEYEDYQKKNKAGVAQGENSKWEKKILLPKGYIGNKGQDIDEESANQFAQIAQKAKKILWNGPVGKFEEAEFRKGSEIIARAVAENKNALRLIGGGDTVELLEELGLQNNMGFVSTGGGAMLEYIANGTLPGLEVLDF